MHIKQAVRVWLKVSEGRENRLAKSVLLKARTVRPSASLVEGADRDRDYQNISRAGARVHRIRQYDERFVSSWGSDVVKNRPDVLREALGPARRSLDGADRGKIVCLWWPPA